MAAAQEGGSIDSDLEGQIDFRDLAWDQCMDSATCTVDGTTLVAESRVASDRPWQVARLYWDPIDGIGVLGGGQDDEIDFNERLIVTFAEPAVVGRIWLTDLFVGEVEHYTGQTSQAVADEDHEFARLELFQDNGSTLAVELTGRLDLPDSSFNGTVDPDTFVDDGDIDFRLIVDGPTVTLQLPSVDETGRRRMVPLRLGTVEAGKLNLFAEGDTFEYDLVETFGGLGALRSTEDGNHNAEAMRDMVQDDRRLSDLRKAAEAQRAIGDVPNGEVASILGVAVTLSKVIFTAPAGTSNDFSVAGMSERSGSRAGLRLDDAQQEPE